MANNDEIKAAAKPVLRFETRRFSMSFAPETVLCMGQPRHVEFAFDDERNLLVVTGKDVATRYTAKLPPPGKKDKFRPSQLHEPEIVRLFSDRFGWEQNKCYEIEGDYDAENRLAVFNLSEAHENGGWENAF